jgi:hypothetical protein
MYFWRTAAGSEVDLVVESEGKLIPLEIKATAIPTFYVLTWLTRLRDGARRQTSGWSGR